LPPTSQPLNHQSTGAPPLPPLNSLGNRKEEENGRKKKEEEREKKRKRKTDSRVYFGWQPVIFQGSDNQVAYLGFICVGARQVIIPPL
jgi:hypothetical protein